jgi:hypothetical protein
LKIPIAVVFGVLLILIAGGVVASYFMGSLGNLQLTENHTHSTSASIISSTSSTQTSVSKAETIAGVNTSTVASDGLRLSTFINATDLTVGQNLNVSISLFNTLPTSNALEQGGSAGAPPGNWTFYGVPVATWPECTPNQFSFGWQFPIEVLILNGNYTAQELSSASNASLFGGPCNAGSGTAFPTYTFESSSDLINITYFASGGAGFGQVGLFRSASHLTVGGYWSLTSLAEQANGTDICEPAVLNVCTLPASTQFAPGVYTVGVTDEWGQFNVLHFQVNGSG